MPERGFIGLKDFMVNKKEFHQKMKLFY